MALRGRKSWFSANPLQRGLVSHGFHSFFIVLHCFHGFLVFNSASTLRVLVGLKGSNVFLDAGGLPARRVDGTVLCNLSRPGECDHQKYG